MDTMGFCRSAHPDEAKQAAPDLGGRVVAQAAGEVAQHDDNEAVRARVLALQIGKGFTA